MTFGSLFSGIGGLDLALEAFGHRVLWQAESDPYARAVLAKHWPAVHCYHDVREIDGQSPPPDIVCGGFPCQDISNAGKRVGIGGERSGLWSEFARIIRALRPRIVFVENVAALTVRGLDRVLGDLAALGFDAEWDVLRAADVGAPHLRARIFILAHAERDTVRVEPGRLGGADGAGADGTRRDGKAGDVADAKRTTRSGGREVAGIRRYAEGEDGRGLHEPSGCGADVPDANEPGLAGERRSQREQSETWIEDARRDVINRCGSAATMGDAREIGREGPGPESSKGRFAGTDGPGWWAAEPDVGRVVTRLPSRVDRRRRQHRAARLRCLGNAVVWQQAALAWETLSARAGIEARRTA